MLLYCLRDVGLLWQILRVQLLMKMNLEFLEENYPCFYAEAEKDIFKARDNKEQLLLKVTCRHIRYLA